MRQPDKLQLHPLHTIDQDKNTVPVVLYENDQTLVEAALVGKANEHPNIPVIVKSTRYGFTRLETYMKIVSCLMEETEFYRTFGPACPHILNFFDKENFADYDPANENFEEETLVIERVLPLNDTLKFIKASGLLNILSVSQGMYQCVRYIHSLARAHGDIKTANFGIDYESQDGTYEDGTLKPTVVKGLDFGTVKKLKIRQSTDYTATPLYIPLYRLRTEISDIGLIKADIFATALTFYDLFTTHSRFQSHTRPTGESIWDWIIPLVQANHKTRFTPEDLLFIFETSENGGQLDPTQKLKKAILLAERLNKVLVDALGEKETHGYQDLDEFYHDFIVSFDTILTEEQLARLLR